MNAKKSAVIFDFNRTLFDPSIFALYQGVLPMLDEERATRKLLLYSKKGWDRKLLLDQLGISEHFTATYFVDRKSVDNLRAILTEHGLRADECIMVGDMLTDEICVGSELGMTTIWFQQARFGSIIGQGVGCVPDHTVHSIPELRDLLRTL